MFHNYIEVVRRVFNRAITLVRIPASRNHGKASRGTRLSQEAVRQSN